jgi:hypothetical protein
MGPNNLMHLSSDSNFDKEHHVMAGLTDAPVHFGGNDLLEGNMTKLSANLPFALQARYQPNAAFDCFRLLISL